MQAQVSRVAPVANHGDVESTFAAYCRSDEGSWGLRPGMTGYARVYGPDSGALSNASASTRKAFNSCCWCADSLPSFS